MGTGHPRHVVGGQHPGALIVHDDLHGAGRQRRTDPVDGTGTEINSELTAGPGGVGHDGYSAQFPIRREFDARSGA